MFTSIQKNDKTTYLLISEYEHESINWPAFLDNFALISGHLAGLSKQLALDYTPILSRFTVLPLSVQPTVDESLVKLTEGRLPIFSAECVPDYLRTKPDPAMESRQNLHEAKATALTIETSAKQVAQYTKIVSHVFDLISKARDDWEIESMNRNAQMPTFSQADTQTLVRFLVVQGDKNVKIKFRIKGQGCWDGKWTQNNGRTSRRHVAWTANARICSDELSFSQPSPNGKAPVLDQNEHQIGFSSSIQIILIVCNNKRKKINFECHKNFLIVFE